MIGDRKIIDSRLWMPVVFAFVLLCLLIFLDELLDLPSLLLGAPPSPYNWREALEELLLVIAIGFLTTIKLIRSLTRRREAEIELKKYRDHLEEMVEERTVTLKDIIDSMTDRMARISEQEMTIEVLRYQLKEAGIEPMADLPGDGDGR